MNYLHACSLLALSVGAVVSHAQKSASGQPIHTHKEFTFVLSAPYADVFPLFGAHKERVWARGFDPVFLYPVPPRDEPGMVFTTIQDGLTRVWVNTEFNPETGHVQYVYTITGTMAALIDIHVTRLGARETCVEVVYERTALTSESNELVSRMAAADAQSGPHWAEMIDGYLQGLGAK